MHGYLTAMKRYGRFAGRASLAEFWGYFLVVNIVGAVLYELLDPGAHRSVWPNLIMAIFVLFHLLPYCALLVRRLHDIDASGLWSLIGIVPVFGLVMLVPAAFKGTIGPNRFGTDPLNTAAVATADKRGEPSHMSRDPTLTRTPARTPEAVDMLGQLEKLARLLDDGTLSVAEFEMMKARLLASGVIE